MSETIITTDDKDLLKPLQQEPQDLITYATASDEDKEKIDQILADLDIHDTHSIISFGSPAQEHLTTISDNMLEGVRNKDVGPAGESLNEMVAVMRGFDTESLDINKQQNFIIRFINTMLGRSKPVLKFLQQYEGVRKQIDLVINKLDGHKTKLLTDIVSLDRLYKANLQYFHELEIYIASGDERIHRLDEVEIPALKTAADNSDNVIKAQELRDLRSRRDDLERRTHDLRLTRQITMQGLPSIRLLQDNDKSLVTKINSTLTNTIPLWRQQLAQAITIYRSGAAADAVKEATDFTNELLVKNAENLKTANAAVRKQVERGIIDIDTIHKANDTLIATIEESLQIADEGRRKREEAVIILDESEKKLRQALLAARAKTDGISPTDTKED